MVVIFALFCNIYNWCTGTLYIRNLMYSIWKIESESSGRWVNLFILLVQLCSLCKNPFTVDRKIIFQW